MKNLKMTINSYEINIGQDNPNLLIHGRTGTGKSTLVHKLIESIQDDFILIESRGVKGNESFILYQCRDGLDIGTPQNVTKGSNQWVGNLSDLEMRLLEEIEVRKLMKEELTPILVVLDELDYMLAERYGDGLDALAYKSRLNHFLKVGAEVEMYFLMTSQEEKTHPIVNSLFTAKIETLRLNGEFTANMNIL